MATTTARAASPPSIPRDSAGTDDAYTPDQLAVMGRAFPNNWDLYKRTAAARARPGRRPSATPSPSRAASSATWRRSVYGNRWTRQQAHIALVGPRNPATGGYTPSTLQQDADIGIETAAVGALLNVGYTISPTHRLGLISMYMHNTEKSTAEVTGIENNGNAIDRLRFRFIERMMQFNQLAGEHAFLSGRLLWNWQGHLAFTQQDEPDSRDLLAAPRRNGVFRIGIRHGYRGAHVLASSTTPPAAPAPTSSCRSGRSS